ncbi:ABC transporter ATP-binding protein [Futiania mangrovi]|uniref:ABC transporter ATP-binding protein n=1 Tax=Futiania mangrovi TaxID=2959716 RepID=A0A9J6PGV4_9PROT|nr:ABC transporter ATP-binding protein [Futiania mangrovii]MCP1337726.1 ABC transporter ATP-binding protein [Futiania mangrovii]
MALLEIRGLSVDIATPAGVVPILEGIDLDLDRGRSLGLVGESGCGKSMTALAVMGLMPRGARVSGTIRFDGEDLVGMSERTLCKLRGNRIAMVFQEPMTALNPVRTIGAQVAEPLRLHRGLSRAEAEAEAVRLLDRVGLPPARFSPTLYPQQLSGGQRQRVVVAGAIACGPDLLIADEPTTALDVTIQAQILDLLCDLVDGEGMALMLITHDLGVVAEATDEMLVMYAGRVAEAGSTADVFARMAHPYTRGLFAAMPQAAGTAPGPAGRRLPTIPGVVPDPAARPAACAFADRCPRVQDDCRSLRPPLVPVGTGHRAACLHPHAMHAPEFPR